MFALRTRLRPALGRCDATCSRAGVPAVFQAQMRWFSNLDGGKPLNSLRNIAIIAHVDHGKTTLVDGLLRASQRQAVKKGGKDVKDSDNRVMDSNVLEQERGITILAKSTSVMWEKAGTAYNINIVDTPGHADFGGEVERIMSMVDGVALVVDATEGPMAQTKFVLSKALAQGLNPLLVINKCDRPSSRVEWVESEIFDLFDRLKATDKQLDFPIIYASAMEGWAVTDLKNDARKSMAPLMDLITKHVPVPPVDRAKPFSMLVTNIHSHPIFGKCLLGRVHSGTAKAGDRLQALDEEGNKLEDVRLLKILSNRGMEQMNAEEALAGDIVSLAGFVKATVNSTLCALEVKEAIKAIPIDPPVLSMAFSVNDSPLSGKDGPGATSAMIGEWLNKENENNISIDVQPSEDRESFEVFGRGELQLGIIIETMRRAGFELSISPPKVVFKDSPEGKLEPVEEVTFDIDQEHMGEIIQKMADRKGDMKDMITGSDGRCRLVFHVPTRSLLGYRSEFLNDTRGTGVMQQMFLEYVPYKGTVGKRGDKGSMISIADGIGTAYAIKDLEARGQMFISPGDQVYSGMVIGEAAKPGDLEVNPVRAKQLTNIRTTSKDEAIRLTPPKIRSLEEMISYVAPDEIIEVTSKAIRLRKKLLDPNERKKLTRSAKDRAKLDK